MNARLPHVNNSKLWNPMKISVIANARIIKGNDLFPKKIEAYKVIAIIGVKFGGWGMNLKMKKNKAKETVKIPNFINFCWSYIFNIYSQFLQK